jgi:phospholipid transport system substrate-binding protein
MRTRLAIASLIAVAALGSSKAALAGPATNAVRDASQTMSALLRKQVKASSAEEKRLAAKVVERLRGFLDVDELGKLALTDHWEKLESAQRTEYLDLLRTLIEANYIRGLRANLEYKVTYDGEAKRGDDLVVTTRVHTKRRGRPVIIEVEYLVRREGDRYKAIDVITDGVGLVENYRAQFNRIIAKEGFEGLLARMRKRASKA